MTAPWPTGRYPRTATCEEIRRDELINIHCGLEDRELAKLIYRALQRDPEVAAHMERYGITLDDLWALIRRGRR